MDKAGFFDAVGTATAIAVLVALLQYGCASSAFRGIVAVPVTGGADSVGQIPDDRDVRETQQAEAGTVEDERPVPRLSLRVADPWVLLTVEPARVTLSNGLDSAVIGIDGSGSTADWSVTYERQREDSWVTCVVARSDALAGEMSSVPMAVRDPTDTRSFTVNWPLSDLTRREFLMTLERLEGGICF